MGSKKSKTVVQNTVPPPTREEREILKGALDLVRAQIENVNAQSIFQADFFERLEAQGGSLEQLAALAERGIEQEFERLDLAEGAIGRAEQLGAEAGGAITAQGDALRNAIEQIEAQQLSPEQQEQLKQQVAQNAVDSLNLQSQAIAQAAARGESTEQASAAQSAAIRAISAQLQDPLFGAQNEQLVQATEGLIAQKEEEIAQAIANGEESPVLLQSQIDLLRGLREQVSIGDPVRQAEIDGRMKDLTTQQLTLRELELQSAVDNGLLSQEAANTQAEAFRTLKSSLEAQPTFDPATQADFNQQQLDLAVQTINLQQQSLVSAAERDELTTQAFQAQAQAVESLRLIGAKQPQLDPNSPQFNQELFDQFNEQSLSIQTGLADLKQQEISKAITRATEEDEFFAQLLETVRSTGEATEAEKALIQKAISGAETAGIARIDLNRDLTLDDLRRAKDTQLSQLGSDIASAVSGIEIDAFTRVNELEAATGTAIEDINTLSQDALERVRDVLAPSRGLRSTDTPITDRGFEIAKEATRAAARAITDLERQRGQISAVSGRQVGGVLEQGIRSAQDIQREFEAGRGLTVQQADQLRAQLSGELLRTGAEQELGRPLQTGALRGELAATGAQLAGLDQTALLRLAQEGEVQDIQALLASGQLGAGLTGQALQDQQFQQQLGQAIEAIRGGQPINLAQATSDIAANLGTQLTGDQQFQLEQALDQERLTIEGGLAVSDIATQQQRTSDVAGQFQQGLGATQVAQQQQLPLQGAQIQAGLGAGITEQQAATDAFQAQLLQNAFLNRLALSGETGGLGLGLAGIGTNLAGVLGTQTQRAIAGTTTTTRKRERDPLGTVSSLLGGVGGLLTGLGSLSPEEELVG